QSTLFRHRFVALRFQLRVLISGKDALGLFHERGATFLSASVLHALLLPCRQFRALVGCQIETREIHATRLTIRGLHVLATTALAACEGCACREQPRCQYR